MVWEKEGPLHENREAPLRFKVVDATGKPMALQPYMGMLGHAAIRRDDGTVFAHLHPVGTISMASQEFFTTGATAAASTDEPVDHSKHLAAADTPERISFPYEFPKAGGYRMWVQVKSDEQVMTGVFDFDVSAVERLR
jgi:hypothetical protein